MSTPEQAPCRWCNTIHGKLCPFVKAMEFDVAGNITRVEFLTAADLKGAPAVQEEAQDYVRLGSGNAQQ